MPNLLNPDHWLSPGGFITSLNGHSSLILQHDGNLVLYRSDGSIAWATYTHGHPDVKYAYMQGDGNFVIYTMDDNVLWSSATHGNNGAFLELEDGGNLVVRVRDGNHPRSLWATNTGDLLPQDGECYINVVDCKNSVPLNDKLLVDTLTGNGETYFREISSLSYEVSRFLDELNPDDKNTHAKKLKNYTIKLEIGKVKYNDTVIDGKLYRGTSDAMIVIDYDNSGYTTSRAILVSMNIAVGILGAATAVAGLFLSAVVYVMTKSWISAKAAAIVGQGAAAAAAHAGQKFKGVIKPTGTRFTVARWAGRFLGLMAMLIVVAASVLVLIDFLRKIIVLQMKIINLTDYDINWSFADLGYANCMAATLPSAAVVKEIDIRGRLAPVNHTKAECETAELMMRNRNEFTGLAYSMKFELIDRVSKSIVDTCSVGIDIPYSDKFRNVTYAEFDSISDYHSFFEKFRGKHEYQSLAQQFFSNDKKTKVDLKLDYLDGLHPVKPGDEPSRSYRCAVIFRPRE